MSRFKIRIEKRKDLGDLDIPIMIHVRKDGWENMRLIDVGTYLSWKPELRLRIIRTIVKELKSSVDRALLINGVKHGE